MNTDTQAGQAGQAAPAPRIQRDIRKVETWEDCDRALGVLRGLQAELGLIGSDFDERIAILQQQKQRASQALMDRQERIEGLVKIFAGANREGATKKGAKSLKMVHGAVGWKKGNPQITFHKSKEHTLGLVLKRGLSSLTNTEVTLDKAALKKLTPEEQKALGVGVVQVEQFFIKLSDDPTVEYPAVTVSEGEDSAP